MQASEGGNLPGDYIHPKEDLCEEGLGETEYSNAYHVHGGHSIDESWKAVVRNVNFGAGGSGFTARCWH